MMGTLSPEAEALRVTAIGAVVLCLALSNPFAVAVADDAGWTPPRPADFPTRFDWVQLPSGEWLGGKLVALYDGTLEFDSEEMGLTRLDWDDLVELRTRQVLAVRPVSGPSAIGRVILQQGRVSVTRDGRTRVFRQSEVLTVAAGSPEERDYWSGEMSGNLNLQSGDSDSQHFNVRALAQRRTVVQRVSLEYIANYDKTDGIETQNNHRVSGDWDRFITDRFFWSPLFFEYYKDEPKNIRHRFTLGPAVGYQVIDNDSTSWVVSGGPAFTQTWFEQVLPGKDDSTRSAALLAKTRVDHELTGDVDLWFDYRFLYGSEETGGYSHRMEFGSSFDVFGDLDLRASYVWDFISDPVEDDAGNVPAQNDSRLLLGVGYTF
jgi:hypothetical protein